MHADLVRENGRGFERGKASLGQDVADARGEHHMEVLLRFGKARDDVPEVDGFAALAPAEKAEIEHFKGVRQEDAGG